jgi:hypothetical protein
MSADETSDTFARRPGVRPFVRTIPVLLLLLGMFMHGACATAGITSSGPAESPQITASAIAELAPAGHSQDHRHHSDHASCDNAVEAGRIALAASFLLFIGLSRCGPGTWLGVCRNLGWTVSRLRASPPGGVPRSALCVMRV